MCGVSGVAGVNQLRPVAITLSSGAETATVGGNTGLQRNPMKKKNAMGKNFKLE